MINEKDLHYLERHWKSIPLPALAAKFSLSPLELASILRTKGILVEVQPFELSFIQQNLERMPSEEIRKKLSLTPSQFSQILSKVLHRKQRSASAEMTIERAIARTRWLIEEKLQVPLDDFLPRTLLTSHFFDNGLSDCISFAEQAKKQDALYKYFTAIAFLVCQAYPHQFRPFQFRHAKTNEYFKGASGKRNLINAARWLIEKKLGYEAQSLPLISTNRYFLRNRDLQFYGIGSHWFMMHFRSRNEFIATLLKEYDVAPERARGSTTVLRAALSDAGRPPSKCEAPGCFYDDEFQLDIHHIIPVSALKQIKSDVNRPDNLIALCPNHHRIASKFDWKQLDTRHPQTWLPRILEFFPVSKDGEMETK